MATCYGINVESVFNSSTYFHVVDGLPPDIMHDVLEGALPYEIKLMFAYYFQNGYFNLKEVNKRLQEFNYGTDSSDKPSSLSAASLCSSGAHLKQSGIKPAVAVIFINLFNVIASQVWCLARYLPLLIGDLIPEGEDHWQNFLLMFDIVDIIFAPVIDQSLVANLRSKIQEHHMEFTRLYPDASVIPKCILWFIILSSCSGIVVEKKKKTYTLIMQSIHSCLRYGPLSRLWCMRFEAKNSYFKRLAQSIGNFKNVCKTVAIRHQRLSCYNLANDSSMFINEITQSGKGRSLSVCIECNICVLACENVYYESLIRFEKFAFKTLR